MLELSTHTSIRDVGAQTWAALGGGTAVPFLSFEFLDALERTGCVGAECGWVPLHLVLARDGIPVAAAPAYVKGNSEGEFVFDFSWAQFSYERLRVPYYPKLVVAAPFTPATTPKILLRPGEDPVELRRAFAKTLPELCERLGTSSAHVLFSPADEADELARAGMAQRRGLQYHWRNAGYASFDEFLSRYPSRRRKRVKRERAALDEQGTDLEVLTGSDLRPDIVDFAYSFYLSTIDKYTWGRQYLNRAFFEEICASSTLRDRIVIVIARDRASRRPLAGAFNLLGDTTLYGRYWGAVEERPFLHFNVCYYQGIEECIRRRLSFFEPGAGGEHKLARGFEPTLTFSSHWLGDARLDRAVRDFVEHEQHAIERHLEEYRADPIFKKDG